MPYPLSNLPTVNEKAALAGTNGVPSAANPYVTFVDSRILLPKFANGNNTVLGGDTALSSTSFVTLMSFSVTMPRTARVVLFASMSQTTPFGISTAIYQIFDNGTSVSAQNYAATGTSGEDDTVSLMVITAPLTSGTSHTFTLQGKVSLGTDFILTKFWSNFGYVF